MVVVAGSKKVISLIYLIEVTISSVRVSIRN